MRNIPGVVIGIVKGFTDPEEEGRIELEFPWLPGPNRSALAAVAAPIAGKGRGFFLMPEKDDEVLVAFDHGDFAHPYIVGYLWNGVDKPPRDERTTRVLVTPGGHTLEFEDAEGHRKITVESDAGHRIVIDDVAQTITLRSAGGLQQIELSDASESVTITGGNRRITMQNAQVTIA